MLPTLNFITKDRQFSDYRPASDPTGQAVVFERTPVRGGQNTVLYLISDLATPNPVPFLTGNNVPASQTRPAWCWTTDQVAFNGAKSNRSLLWVWTVDSDGANPLLIPKTAGFCYPNWSREGTCLVTENGSTASALPRPRNTLFSPTGEVVAQNINGSDDNHAQLFGGMPAVGPQDLPQIAFAGQPAITGWGDGASSPGYNQDYNYIFLNTCAHDTYTSSPMEAGASIAHFDSQHQGRSPAWSPDGQYIAFESNRVNGSRYAIFLCKLAAGRIVRVTDPHLDAQHAKFLPCGTKLILSSRFPGGNEASRGIAWVDIEELL